MGELCLQQSAVGDTPVGSTPVGDTPVGDTLPVGSGTAGEWHLWRRLAWQDGAWQQLCRGQQGAGLPGMVPGGATVQENGTRNGGIGNGAGCQELWGRKGVLVAQGRGQCCWEVIHGRPPPSGTSQRALQSPGGLEWEKGHFQVAKLPLLGALPLSLAEERPLGFLV